MTGEGQLAGRREDADADRAVVAEVVDEDRLRVAEGRRYRLHRVVGQEALMDAEVVAAPAVAGEHADDSHGDRSDVVGHPSTVGESVTRAP